MIDSVQRIAVIGNGAGGKTALARRLGERLGIPHHEVDAVQFRPDWSRVPAEKVTPVVDRWATGDAWVIDGYGPWQSIERRLAAADTIVWVDFPLQRHLWWAAKRQLHWGERPQRRPPSRLMLKMILFVHRTYRPSLQLAVAPHAHKLVHLRSPRDLRRWLENPGAES